MIANKDLPLSPHKVVFIWILVASSSVVMIEPAPYDFLVLALLLYFFIDGLKIPPYIGTAIGLLSLFALANITSAIFASDPTSTLAYMAITFFLILSWLFFVSITWVQPERMLIVIFDGYVFAAVFAVVMGTLGFFHLIPHYDIFLYEGRAKGSFKDANVFGPFLIPAFMYTFYRFGTVTGMRRIVFLVFTTMLLSGIFLSFSRGAWVNLAFALIVYTAIKIYTARTETKIWGIFILYLLLVGAMLLIPVIISFNTQLHSLFFERALLFQDYDIESGGRFNSLLHALQYSFTDPIGLGPGQSLDYFETEPHSLYIHILVETGWLGALAYIGFLLLTLYQALVFSLRRSSMQNIYLVVFASTVGLLAESIIIHSTHWRHFYLLLALLWGPIIANTIRKTEKSDIDIHRK